MKSIMKPIMKSLVNISNRSGGDLQQDGMLVGLVSVWGLLDPAVFWEGDGGVLWL